MWLRVDAHFYEGTIPKRKGLVVRVVTLKQNKIEIVFNELDSNKATIEAVFLTFGRILCFLFI